MRRDKGWWPGSFGLSIVAHVALLAILCGVAVLMPPPEEKGPIEVDLVADVGGGGGGGGSPQGHAEGVPQIHEAAATPTAPPPAAPATPADPEAANDVHSVADTPQDSGSSDSSAPSADSSSSGDSDRGYGSGSGSGGGNGSGSGTGTGSGTGEGSGSGSGGGDGSGSGGGDGAGDDSSSGGETMGPQILSAPAPSYPESARRSGASGTTVVGLTISSDGSVSSAWVESSSGNGALDQAAVQAVYSWQFVPAKQNGQAITVNSRVPVTFNLR